MDAARKTLPWACAALAFVVYVWFAAPGPYWLDSQELGSASVMLGVPHPTGFPLFCIVGRLFAWLPLGELAFRVHLGSACAAAIAVGVAARLTAELAGDDRTALVGGVATALILGGAMTFFRMATVTEVYASAVAALVVAISGLLRVLRGGSPGHALGLALFAGAAATGLHSSFALLLLVPCAVIYALRLRGGARWPLAAPLCAVLGAAGVAVYLPARSASGHVERLDWGHTDGARATLDHLLAGRIRRSFEDRMLSTGAATGNAGKAGQQLDGDVGALALLAAAAGTVALAWRRGRRGALLLIGAVAAGDALYAVYVNPMGLVERQTGTPLLLCVAVLGGVGVAAAARFAGRFAPFAAAALAVVVGVAPLAGGAAAKAAARGSDAPRALGEQALAEAPPQALVLTRGDSLSSILFWLTIVEPLRPDVAVLARQHLWDQRRVRAVLAATAAPRPAPPRPVAWEVADDVPPRDVPYAAGIPLSWVGRAAPPGAPPIPDLDRIFAAAATDDDLAAPVARRLYNNLGVLFGRAGDLLRAAQVTERGLAFGVEPLALVNAGRYRLALGQDSLARPHLEEAARRTPDRAAVWALLGVIEARAGHCRLAAEHFARALRLDPAERDARTNQARLGECRER